MARVVAPRHESSAWLKQTTSPRWNHECLKSFTSTSSPFGKVDNEVFMGCGIEAFSVYITTRPVISPLFLAIAFILSSSFFSKFPFFLRLVRVHSFVVDFHSFYKSSQVRVLSHSFYRMSSCIKKTCLLAFLLLNCEF